MKKVLLTISAAFIMSITVWAQDTTQQSNQFRTDPIDQADEQLDTATYEFNDEAREEGQNIREGVDETSTDFREQTEQAGDTLMQELEEAGNEVQDNSQESFNLRNDQDMRDDNINDNPNQDMNQPAEPAPQDETTPQSDLNQDEMQNQQAAAQAEVEVVEDKEGPNNEVVYKYQGDFYMVDREEEKFIKVEESELSDANHDVMIHEGTATENDGRSGKTKG